MRNAFSSLVRRKSVHSKCLIAFLAVGSCSVAVSPELYAKPEIDVYENMQAQTKTVTGVVLDDIGETLYGVSVRVKGTTIGTVTDLDGKFTLQVPTDNPILVFSYISYLPQEINVATVNSVNIVLEEDSQILEDIVIVGYGVQRKSDVVGSIGVTTGEKLLQAPVNSALDGLKGKVAGVTVFNTTGNPMGEQGPRVLIRGVNSIKTGTGPLYVVDGVQMDNIQFVNPNDIERMEVLKDASATAIYGARGANGVILVTTKRGTTGKKGKTIVSYAGWMSVSTLFKELELLNSREFMEVERLGMANIPLYKPGQSALTPNTSDARLFDASGNPLYDTNWQREATRDAFSHSHQVNIQTQGDKSSVGAFFNFTDKQGVLLNNYSKRLNAKVAYDVDANKWLSVSTNLMINHIWGNSVVDDGGSQNARRTMLEMPPIFPVKYADGSWANSQSETLNYDLEAMTNPVHELTEAKRNRYHTKIFGNLAATFHILPGLDLRTQIGIDANIKKKKQYEGVDMVNMSAPDGRGYIDSNESLYWQEETYLTYLKTINKVHRLNLMAGLSWSQRDYQFNNSGEVKGFTDDYFGYDNLGAGTKPSAPTSGWERWSMNSYFARGSYTFKDRYMATATLRADGSSRFGENNKYAVFPSMGLGWILTEEDFLKGKTPWLSNLKLHTSYGSTGNTEIDVYQSLPLLESTTILQGEVRVPYNYKRRMANPDLKWERTDQFDIGLDFGLLNNRINVEASYYYKKTNDLLMERPLPYTSGFSTVMDNIGRVDNYGIDLMLNTTNIQTKDFRWESTLSFNYNKNEIKKLGVNNEDILTDPAFLDGQIILRVGESLGTFYGYERLGTYSQAEGDAEIARATAKGENPLFFAGEAKRSENKSILGKGMPDITGSFINSFYYKNFDFTFDLQFVTGVEVRQNFFHSLEDRVGIANSLKNTLYDAWRPDNQNTMIQQVRHAVKAGHSSKSDSHWIANGAYLRGNLIQLGYTFDSKTLKSIGLSSFRVNASVNNAFVIHSKDFKGYDPESTSYSDRFGQNTFFYQYPSSRTFALGVNLSF